MSQQSEGNSSEQLKTPLEWAKEIGVRIIDADGWRWEYGDGLQPKDFGEPIDKIEFEQRAMRSTMMRTENFRG